VAKPPELKRWLTLREGEAYSCTLGPRRELYLLKEDDGTWTLWWGQWGKEPGKPPLREKTLASRLTFEQALKRGNDYLDWWFGRKGKQ